MDNFDPLINFGISLPTISSPSIKMYFPFNFIDSLKLNATEYFSRELGIDTQNQTIIIPKYIEWIEPIFIDNLNKYIDYLPRKYITFVKGESELKTVIGKYDWKLNYSNFKNLQLDVQNDLFNSKN